MKNNIVTPLFLYLNEVGSNSNIDINIIIPAIIEKIHPIIVSVTILLKNKYAKSAPKGSESAEIRVYNIALFLLLDE